MTFSIINIGGFASKLIKFEGCHDMTIVEMDGVATVSTGTSTIKIASAQQYVMIVTALPTATKNYGILSTPSLPTYCGALCGSASEMTPGSRGGGTGQ